MASKNRSGNANKRKGSQNPRKMMSSRVAARRYKLHLDSKDKLARRAAARVIAKNKFKEGRVC